MSAADALQEWLDKAQWFKPQPHQLGMHKLDAIRETMGYYIGLAARGQIQLGLVEQLLEDPHQEFTASDMEYWEPLHDDLYKKLTQ